MNRPDGGDRGPGTSTAQELAAELRSIGARLPSGRLRHAAGLLERAAGSLRNTIGEGPADDRLTKLLDRLRTAGEEAGACAARLGEVRGRLDAYVTGSLGMSGIHVTGPQPRPGTPDMSGGHTPDGTPRSPAKE